MSSLKLSAVFLLLSLPAAAQDADQTEEQYKQMMEQMMKSGNNYSQSQAQSWDARLKTVAGSVMIKPAGADEWSKAEGEVPLDPDDEIKTASDGQAEIYMDDKGVIFLDRNTELAVSSLEQQDASLSLKAGSLVAKIKHFLNEKFKFAVRTPSAVCAVRGTEFAVEYSQLSGEAAAAVYDEGRVEVSVSPDPGKDPQQFTLEKNTELVVDPSRKRFHPEKIFRMGRHRGTLGQVRKRLAGLKGWKPLSPQRRAALRDRALKREVIRRQLNRKPASKARKAVKKRGKARSKSGRTQ